MAANGEAVPAPVQLRFGLARYEGRPESAVYLEEWAVVSVAGGHAEIASMSTPGFGAKVADSMPLNIPTQLRDGSFLVVEAAEHPLNSRAVPTPALEPFEVQIGRQQAFNAEGFWFRAEVDGGGNVDRVMLIDPVPVLPREGIEAAIRTNLRLQYPGERRHRSVVFAQGNVDRDGRLAIDKGPVIVPNCCCSECCNDPEYGWICPCGGPCIPQ